MVTRLQRWLNNRRFEDVTGSMDAQRLYKLYLAMVSYYQKVETLERNRLAFERMTGVSRCEISELDQLKAQLKIADRKLEAAKRQESQQ